jgi:phosphatidate phosphatase APP1
MGIFDNLKPDSPDKVVLYPSIGIHHGDGKDCEIQIRGRIFEDAHLPDSFPKVIFDRLGFGKFGIDPEQAKLEIFKERITHILVDGKGGEPCDIEIAGVSTKSSKSDDHGFFGFGQLPIAMQPAKFKSESSGGDAFWVSYTARSKDNGAQPFAGRSRLLRQEGAIVVSDIDDTIKDSNVPNVRELLLNTFFRRFNRTPGMLETYQAWEKKNATFIYLSNSPYQLYEPLRDYLQGEQHYPEGAYYMCQVGAEALANDLAGRLKIDTTVGLTENPKKHNLIPILEAFPNRKFILVGDSTERDAEIYVDLYEGTNFPGKFPAPAGGYKKQIKKIYIRDVKNSSSEAREAAVRALARINDLDIARFFDAQNPDILEDALPSL